MHAIEKSFECACEYTWLLAVNTFEVPGPADFPGADVPIPSTDIGGIKANPESLLAREQRCFCLLRRLQRLFQRDSHSVSDQYTH
jgi:hypothetical protein